MGGLKCSAWVSNGHALSDLKILNGSGAFDLYVIGMTQVQSMATTQASEENTSCSSDVDKTIQTIVKETNGIAKIISTEAGSSTYQRSKVSLLEKLKAPTPADITRKHKMKANPPPVGSME